MEEFGVSGFNGGTAVAKKRRSTPSRRPRPDSQLLLEGRDPSPPSSTPSSENASKQSTDGSSGHDASVRRKEVNLSSLVPKIPSADRNEGVTASGRTKKDDKSWGDFDGFYGGGVQRPSRSNAPNHGFSELKRSSEGVLAPANWKSYTKCKERLSPDSHVDSGKSSADVNVMGQSEPTPNGSAENKLRKVKLKVGGVTHTIHAKSNAESGTEGGSSTKPPRPSDSSRHRQKLILKDKSDDDPLPQDKGDAFQGVPWKDFSDGSFSSASKESSVQGKPTDGMVSRKQIDKAQSMTAFEPVRKSKRVPKRRVLDGAFDGDDEDDEIRYLERLKTSKFNSDHSTQQEIGGSEGNKKQKSSKVSKRASYEMDEDFSMSRRSKEGRNKLRSEPEDIDYIEEEAGSDASESKSKKHRKESLDSLSDNRKEFSLTTRQRALQSVKDGSGGSTTSLIEFPNGLPPAPPRKQKGKLSEVEQQLKKAEAAHRRRMQVEKAARESEAEAIRKILGQDSNRKRREEKLQKRRDELAQEKAAKSMALAANTVRWIMGPSGTIVTFPEGLGLPSIFDSKPCSYPPPREKCVGPLCTNSYKYRDSKSNLPLCSLQCYRAVQQIVQQ